MVDEDRLDGVAEGAFYTGPRQRMNGSMALPFEYRIPKLEGAAFVVNEGQTIRVTDVEGGQICDFVAFNRHNVRERFDQGRTKANQGKILLSTGDHLISKSNTKLMTITADTCPDLDAPYGIHDLQWGMCNKYIFDHWDDPDYEGISEESWKERKKEGNIPEWGCWENLAEALEPWGIAPEDVPSPINFFQTMKFDLDTGETQIVPGESEPGDYVELVANVDCLVGISACPSSGKPLDVTIEE